MPQIEQLEKMKSETKTAQAADISSKLYPVNQWFN